MTHTQIKEFSKNPKLRLYPLNTARPGIPISKNAFFHIHMRLQQLNDYYDLKNQKFNDCIMWQLNKTRQKAILQKQKRKKKH